MPVTAFYQKGTRKERLNDRQATFVEEYMVDFDATRAARAAGYKQPRQSGNNLIKTQKIKQAIGRLRHERQQEIDLNREEVLQELAYIVFSDIGDLINEDGHIVVNDMRKVPVKLRRCIKKIKARSIANPDGSIDQVIEIDLHDKLKGIELAMKHLGLLEAVDSDKPVKVDWEEMYKQTPPNVIEALDVRLKKEEGR